MGGTAPISEFFVLKEVSCKCGECRLTFISTELLLLMDSLRRQWKKPLKPNSVFRCQSHNRSLSNSSRFSAHCSGQACDWPLPIEGRDEFIKLVKDIFPFSYIGDGFIHAGLFNR